MIVPRKVLSPRTAAVKLYKMMECLGGSTVLCRRVQVTGAKSTKPKKSEQDIRDGYMYIQNHSPDSTHNMENLIWAEVEQGNEDSPIYGWDMGRIEKALSQKFAQKAVAKPVVGYDPRLSINPQIIEDLGIEEHSRSLLGGGETTCNIVRGGDRARQDAHGQRHCVRGVGLLAKG
eukprot:4091673-Amphidinium_carterae.1